MPTYFSEQRIHALLASLKTGLFIGGEWRDAADGTTFAVENPATREVLARVANGGSADARAALDAASHAQARWAATPSRERAEILRRVYERVVARTDDFALLMTLEMGKPIPESRGEVTLGAEYLRWFSEVATHFEGANRPSPEGGLDLFTIKKPVGPVLLITPWNFPLAMATRKLAPAIAAGCTAVIKPARLTPLTTLLFTQILAEQGVPAGVVNVVPGAHASAISGPLLSDPRIRKLSFTGSTEVGRELLAQAAPNVLRTSMELGGNAPFLVFDDADLDVAIDSAVIARLRNMGEVCTAANRFYVQRGVFDEFARRLAGRFAAKRVGDGNDRATDIGPLVEQAALDKVAGLVDDAVSKGARVLAGGSRAPEAGPGYFYQPTVLVDLPSDARILTTEIFGPVAQLIPFDDEDEAVRLANSTPFGLMSYAFTSNLARAQRLPWRIESGLVTLNAPVAANAAAPFGGVKQSGIGREGGDEGIEEYLETVYVAIPRPKLA